MAALVTSGSAELFRIVVYGDSNTYGWIPNLDPPSTRYSPEQRQLPSLYEAVAKMGSAEFQNAGAANSIAGVDGLHFTPAAHRKLGAAIAAKVKEISKVVLCRN